jgi:hypothetical protein
MFSDLFFVTFQSQAEDAVQGKSDDFLNTVEVHYTILLGS